MGKIASESHIGSSAKKVMCQYCGKQSLARFACGAVRLARHLTLDSKVTRRVIVATAEEKADSREK